MVQACKAAGIAVCVCTGRNWSEAKGVVQKAGIDTYCVINNGAAIIDIPSERRIYRNRFAPETLRAIAALVEQEYPDCAFGVSATYASHELEPRMHEGFRRYIDACGSASRSAWTISNSTPPWTRHCCRSCENDAQRIDLGLDVYANAQTLSKKLLHLGGVGDHHFGRQPHGDHAQGRHQGRDAFGAGGYLRRKARKRDGLWRQLQRSPHAHVGRDRRGDGQCRRAPQGGWPIWSPIPTSTVAWPRPCIRWHCTAYGYSRWMDQVVGRRSDGTFCRMKRSSARMQPWPWRWPGGRGIRVCACTGRGLLEARTFFFATGLTGTAFSTMALRCGDTAAEGGRNLCFPNDALRALCRAARRRAPASWYRAPD